jgi:type IV secretory pathway TrbL component
MEEVVKNSISMIEFKKSQFLLEESKNSVVIDLENTKKELETKNIEFKKERSLNYILLSSLVVLIILSLILWFVKI